MPPKKPKQWAPKAFLTLLDVEGQQVVVSTGGTEPGRVGQGRPSTRDISTIASWVLYWGDGQSESGDGAPAFQYTHTYDSSVLNAVIILDVIDVNTLRARATLTVTLEGDPPATVPSAPTDLVASPIDTTSIRLTWTDVATNEEGYTVERWVGAGPWTPVASLPADTTTYVDSGLTQGTTYNYRLRAFNAAGTSAYTPTVEATTQAGSPPPPPPAPAAPSGLTAVASPTQAVIQLEWTDNASDEDGFVIERRVAPAAFAEVATPGPDVTTYLDTGLAANVTYEYRVKAVNAGGSSAYSGTASATTPVIPAPPPPLPTAPTALVATAQGSTTIGLTWTDNATDEDGYTLERRVGSDPAWAVLATLPADTAAYLDQNLTAATQYTYRVRAFNATGVSVYSNTASAITDAAPTPPPDPTPPPPDPPPPPPPTTGPVSIVSVSGVIAQDQLLTIDGTGFINESMAGWDPFCLANLNRVTFDAPNGTDITNATQFGSGGYQRAGNGVVTTARRLLGSGSVAFRSTCQSCPAGAQGQDYNNTPGLSIMNIGNIAYIGLDASWDRNTSLGIDRWSNNFSKWIEVPFGDLYIQPRTIGLPNATNPLEWLIFQTQAPGGGTQTGSIFPPKGGRIVSQQWYHFDFKIDRINHLLDVAVDGTQVVSGHTLYSKGGPGIILFGTINAGWGATPVNWDINTWMDRFIVSSQPTVPATVVELSDNPVYGAGALRHQAPEFQSETQAQVRCDLTGLGGGPYYLYLRNSQQQQSTAFGPL